MCELVKSRRTEIDNEKEGKEWKREREGGRGQGGGERQRERDRDIEREWQSGTARGIIPHGCMVNASQLAHVIGNASFRKVHLIQVVYHLSKAQHCTTTKQHANHPSYQDVDLVHP